MESTNQSERKKSVLGAIAAGKLSEMLKNIDISSIKESHGGYNVRARILALFDMGTFAEIGTYIVRREVGEEPSETFSGVITGYGAVNGRLCYAFVQDSARMHGAFDSTSAEKIAALLKMAVRNGAPVVGIFDSSGASIYEGVKVLAAYGEVMKQITAARGIVPLVALVPGICGGGMAAAASSFDFLLTVSGQSEFYVASPFISGEKAADGASAADIAVDDEDELYVRARELLSYLPANCNEGSRVSETPVLERGIQAQYLGADTYDAKKIIASLADGERFIELGAGRTPELVTGLAYIGGIVCGVMANDPGAKDGMMTPAACRAAAGLVRFCDCFGLPLVALVNSAGVCWSESDSAGYASAVAELYHALTASCNAKISVVTGKAYGMGFTLMASKSVGADVAFALPGACISPMSPEASVALVWNDRICDNDVTVTREELEAEWRSKLASPSDAAICGEIDDIISADELRPRIVSAIRMLAAKSRDIPTPPRESRRKP